MTCVLASGPLANAIRNLKLSNITLTPVEID
jgi:hypothetical protein